MIPMETERKFIIEMPGDELLRTLPSSDIVQTYLVSEAGVTERVRMRTQNGISRYTHTKKVRISKMTSREDEREIGKDEYDALLLRADPERAPILKTRFLLSKNGFLFEIDIYPFWKKQAVMEVETETEEVNVTLPDEIRVIREVTGDRAYSNASLALNIPEEEI